MGDLTVFVPSEDVPRTPGWQFAWFIWSFAINKTSFFMVLSTTKQLSVVLHLLSHASLWSSGKNNEFCVVNFNEPLLWLVRTTKVWTVSPDGWICGRWLYSCDIKTIDCIHMVCVLLFWSHKFGFWLSPFLFFWSQKWPYLEERLVVLRALSSPVIAY